MTKLEAINRAKSYLLLQMTRFLDTSRVADAIASFAADFQNYDTERDLNKINEDIDYLIDRLNSLKGIVNEEKQAILDADK